MNAPPKPPDRRQILAGAAAAVSGALLPEAASAQAAKKAAAKGAQAAANVLGGHKFFSPSEFALLDELAETIIPADERSGGARAAKVAEYLDARIAELIEPSAKQSWHDDLATLDALSVSQFGKPFVAAAPQQRIALLERISRNEKNPKSDGEVAFDSIKSAVSQAYYTSRIGIHDELHYKGNVLQDEFSGTDVSRK